MIYNKIGFIGAGSVVQTMVRGLITNDVVKGHKIWVTNRKNRAHLLDLWKEFNVNCTVDKKKVLDNTDTIILAIKPQDMQEVLKEIKPIINEKQLLISVTAGITTQSIASILEKNIAIIRVMPNTSCAVGASATAIAKGKLANNRHLATASKLFESLGEVVVVGEKDMDFITGLSGSGPAYFYYMVELMQKTAVSHGLSEETAKKLIVQTLYGAAKMLKENNEEPAVLRKKVTSPNGTTYAALKVFERMGFENTVTKAIVRASVRSTELGQEFMDEYQIAKLSHSRKSS